MRDDVDVVGDQLDVVTAGDVIADAGGNYTVYHEYSPGDPAYTLGAGLENLVITGSFENLGEAPAPMGTGNDLNNLIRNDGQLIHLETIINGAGGNDTLIGGDFSDRFTFSGNFGNGIGDLNPLYRDLESGRLTRHGSMLAHPNFPMAFGWVGRTRWGLRGVHGFYAGNDWELFRHVRPGDRISAIERVVGVEVKESQFSGTLVIQYVEETYASDLLTAGGGVGYLLKDRVSRLSDLSDALERVVAGGTVLDPEVV